MIGGGAAGMMAAVAAAGPGRTVSLYDKNEKLGKKLYITGKGRCNLTNACESEQFFQSVCTNPKFLYSAFYGFSNEDVMDFFRKEGLALKTERGQRVFPCSDHASDVTAVLARAMEKGNVRIHLKTKVADLLISGDGERRVLGVALANGTKAFADAVIVCTGGLSYPSTGSDGDGLRMARQAGHRVTKTTPSLVPIQTLGEDAPRMQGLSLKNVQIRIFAGKRLLFEDFGEMMFTHFGVTGPLILSASAVVGKELLKHPLTLSIDLKNAITEQQLDARLLREFDAAKNRRIGNVLGAVYPAKLIPVLLERCAIPAEKPVHEISREERKRLVSETKQFTFTLTSLRSFSEAVITRGGVEVKEIHPDTMESKLIKGLYFAGEVLDVDALTGGFNLQIAWSTGYAAGKAAGGTERND